MNSQGTWDHSCSLSSTAFLHFSFVVPLSSLVLSLPVRPPHWVLSPPANAPHLYLLPSAWAGHPDGKETFIVQGDRSDRGDSENRKLRRGLYFGLSVTPDVWQRCTAWWCCLCHCTAARHRLNQGYQLLIGRKKLSEQPHDRVAYDSGG